MAGPIAALFDIDETLVHTGGSGRRSWAWAFDRLHGVAADIGEHTSAGETDPQVGRKTFLAVLGREPSHDEMARLYAAYLWHLSEDIPASEGYRVLDGVEDTLRQITDAGIILGLISGAMEGAARIKMERGRLGRYFVFGAYGSDSPDRAEITRLAMAKAARLHGHDLTRSEVYVVGDTPRDIEAARAANATAVGVASGHYSVEELRAAQADHVLTALTEPFPRI
ncbi:HAD hydrolase-like protein [Streptomyces sp. SID8361]|uniref:HAD family hydrolase n=1 Tax=Streptomyces TaxID=1883 RepID=UPI00081DB66E|nr:MULTISPECIES: HAD family hydrolase [unclassified Streptomyces]AUA10261.1 Phosphoglycolate phosphatase [Streptomyces sp. M56]MYU12384.1 HAD hydrolase-like protein [Streptomyces sp. SID8361]MYX61001.1 HAD hydrolase-like protein [Streptomyces sp. SID8382]SCF91005.1 Phosphoglycolate phosphatase, HAD superfamily [Streptomyces sp. MnatMP-M27]